MLVFIASPGCRSVHRRLPLRLGLPRGDLAPPQQFLDRQRVDLRRLEMKTRGERARRDPQLLLSQP